MNGLRGEKLNTRERERYARQIALPEIGLAGQSRLARASVLVIGLGGLGSPAVYYLAAAGIGTLGLADCDTVATHNLQRQILHFTPDVGLLKTRSASAKAKALNPLVRVITHPLKFARANAARLLAGYDFVIDATDNFKSKILIADACHAARKPYSHAGISGFHGQTMTVIPGRTACYQCVFGDPPRDPVAPRGPLGALAGVIGSIQAAEALKCILGLGGLLSGRLLTFDLLKMKFREIQVQRNPRCRLCAG